jgi:hypothetical protein
MTRKSAGIRCALALLYTIFGCVRRYSSGSIVHQLRLAVARRKPVYDAYLLRDCAFHPTAPNISERVPNELFC